MSEPRITIEIPLIVVDIGGGVVAGDINLALELLDDARFWTEVGEERYWIAVPNLGSNIPLSPEIFSTYVKRVLLWHNRYSQGVDRLSPKAYDEKPLDKFVRWMCHDPEKSSVISFILQDVREIQFNIQVII